MSQFYENLKLKENPAGVLIDENNEDVSSLVLDQRESKVPGFIERFVGKFGDPCGKETLVIPNSESFENALKSYFLFELMVNLPRLNDTKKLCCFLSQANHKIKNNGVLVCCLETTKLRRDRFFREYSSTIWRVYYFLDYLLMRVAPTMRATKWIYKIFASGKNRPVAYYEMIGRLFYCGFRVEYDEVIEGHHYIAARKVSIPPANLKENYGLIIRLHRVGKGGKKIKVYKFRTMVAFSEYVQEHIYQKYKLREGGKFKNDKRVTVFGGIIRKCWVDELPMIVNLLKGEIKLVGVRPLSAQYLALYRDDVIKQRLSVKPGLIPPYYVDLPSNLDEIQQSELNYIERWKNRPLKTDVVYFFRAAQNILWRGARSK